MIPPPEKASTSHQSTIHATPIRRTTPERAGVARLLGCPEQEVSDWELAIKQKDIQPQEKSIRTGLLFTAGLVAGEALTGVVIAILIVIGINLTIFTHSPWWPGLIIWIFIGILLAYIPIRNIIANK